MRHDSRRSGSDTSGMSPMSRPAAEASRFRRAISALCASYPFADTDFALMRPCVTANARRREKSKWLSSSFAHTLSRYVEIIPVRRDFGTSYPRWLYIVSHPASVAGETLAMSKPFVGGTRGGGSDRRLPTSHVR